MEHQIIHSLWFRYYDETQLLKLLNIISNRNNIFNLINTNFWLIYISLLYENNNKDLSKQLLIEYYKKFNFNNIHNFFVVSKIAKEIGIINENIEKSAFIYKKLSTNIENNIFENILARKTVAVVGNGP